MLTQKYHAFRNCECKIVSGAHLQIVFRCMVINNIVVAAGTELQVDPSGIYARNAMVILWNLSI